MKQLLVVLAVLFAASTTSAQVRVRFTGRGGDVLAREVSAALEEAGIDVTTRESDARVVITGAVRRARGSWSASIELSGDTHAIEHFSARRAPALQAAVRQWARDTLPDLVPAPAEPEPPAALDLPHPAPVPETPDEAPVSRPRPPPLAVRASTRVIHRTFHYQDDLFGRLRTYELGAAPAASLAAEWYPVRHTDLDALHGLSLWAEGEMALGVESAVGNGAPQPTDLWSFGAGVRMAITVDDLELAADLGYRAAGFAVRAPEDERPPLPNVEVHALRAGAGARWNIGAGVFLNLQAAYLHPLALGEIASDAWFPRASAGGVEGDTGLGVRIDDIELRALFAVRRFFYAMNPEPGDPHIAGGALDQTLSGGLELTWRPSQLAGDP